MASRLPHRSVILRGLLSPATDNVFEPLVLQIEDNNIDSQSSSGIEASEAVRSQGPNASHPFVDTDFGPDSLSHFIRQQFSVNKALELELAQNKTKAYWLQVQQHLETLVNSGIPLEAERSEDQLKLTLLGIREGQESNEGLGGTTVHSSDEPSYHTPTRRRTIFSRVHGVDSLAFEIDSRANIPFSQLKYPVVRRHTPALTESNDSGHSQSKSCQAYPLNAQEFSDLQALQAPIASTTQEPDQDSASKQPDTTAVEGKTQEYVDTESHSPQLFLSGGGTGSDLYELIGSSGGKSFTIRPQLHGTQLIGINYNRLLPETVPLNPTQAQANRAAIFSVYGFDATGIPSHEARALWPRSEYSRTLLRRDCYNLLSAPDANGIYPRKFTESQMPRKPTDPPHVTSSKSIRAGFPWDFWDPFLIYLSSQDVRNLRLVNKVTANEIAPYMFRSTVVKFGQNMFTLGEEDGSMTANSPFAKYGNMINKFGVCFEYDSRKMMFAPDRATYKIVDAWFGSYKWPLEDHLLFEEFKAFEELLDHKRKVLDDAFQHLSKTSELALSLDNGHGWLNGIDQSDLALWKERSANGTPMFGKTFDSSDKMHEYALRQYFVWAQERSLNLSTKANANTSKPGLNSEDRIIQRIMVKEYDDFKKSSDQPDFNPNSHIGMEPASVSGSRNPYIRPNPIPANVPVDLELENDISWFLNSVRRAGQETVGVNPTDPPYLRPCPQTSSPKSSCLVNSAPDTNGTKTDDTEDSRHIDAAMPSIVPQWPIIFNGFNIAAQVGGDRSYIQNNLPNPEDYALKPGKLTEPQAHWLKETSWTQKNFLIEYVNSVITNKDVLSNVHSLHLVKISSGLLAGLHKQKFWRCLPKLQTVTLLVNPDWRREHVLGEILFNNNMKINPVDASAKLAHLLKHYVAPLENISNLTIGFTAGGEHATGMFARNSHVLPAPITDEPMSWVKNSRDGEATKDLIQFNHIRKLVFKNCWFSPAMLKSFMYHSRDSSLHHLTLDSVSLTGIDKTESLVLHPVATNNLRCQYNVSNWLREEITPDHCWVQVLDAITPGHTIRDKKYDAGVVDEKKSARPPPEFRGHVKTISLQSCGYVVLSGFSSVAFNQRGLAFPSSELKPTDEGLTVRKAKFLGDDGSTLSSILLRHQLLIGPDDPILDHFSLAVGKDIMMTILNPETGHPYCGLGKLTSCIHPVEKRVLEQAWGMRFGWGDSMKRWEAVEDGYFEGGTGRFSGILEQFDTNTSYEW